MILRFQQTVVTLYLCCEIVHSRELLLPLTRTVKSQRAPTANSLNRKLERQSIKRSFYLTTSDITSSTRYNQNEKLNTKIPFRDSYVRESYGDYEDPSAATTAMLFIGSNESDKLKTADGDACCDRSSCPPCCLHNTSDNPCSFRHQSGLNVVDCSGLSLAQVDPGWFPASTNQLLLDRNQLKNLPGCLFFHLKHLRHLSITQNGMKNLESNAFWGLENLETLNLENNDLHLLSFPPGVFDPITNLLELRIEENRLGYGTHRYPDDFPKKMKMLQVLYMDLSGEYAFMDEEFHNLSNLTYLQLNGNTAKLVDENSFINVPYLTSLVLRNFDIVSNFSDLVFAPLEQLNILRLVAVRVGVTPLLAALSPLRGKTMSTIEIDSVDLFAHDSYSSFIKSDGVLSYNKTVHLLEICVESFSLTASSIYAIQADAIGGPVWDKCLRRLDFSYNPLLGTKSAYIRIFNLKSLEQITIENIMTKCYSTGKDNTDSSIANKYFSVKTEACDNTSRQQTRTLAKNSVSNESTCHRRQRRDIKAKSKSMFSKMLSGGTEREDTWVTISKSLKSISLQASISSSNIDRNIRFVGAENLRHLDLSLCKFHNFQGNITGMTGLQSLDFSFNDLSVLAETFFDNFPQLENLYLSDSSLDVEFMSRKSGRVFKTLLRLTRLDISLNLLNSLSIDMFLLNSQLEELNLSKNRFHAIPFNLKHTPRLRLLDLRQNSLLSLEKEERNQLDELSSQNNLRLLISGNAFHCGCQDLHFLHWMMTTLVQFDQSSTLNCLNDLGQTIELKSDLDLAGIWRKCVGSYFLSVAIILLFSISIGFMIFFFVWKHHIFIKSAVLQFFTGYKLKQCNDYSIGVYIGYSEANYSFPCFDLRKFIERDLKLTSYVLQRDMRPGSDIAGTIADAINSSWRIILLFTSQFLTDDQWSLFTYRTAIYAQRVENPSRLVILVEKDLRHRLPPEVVGAVMDDNIIVVSSWELSYELKEKLKHRLH